MEKPDILYDSDKLKLVLLNWLPSIHESLCTLQTATVDHYKQQALQEALDNKSKQAQQGISNSMLYFCYSGNLFNDGKH